MEMTKIVEPGISMFCTLFMFLVYIDMNYCVCLCFNFMGL